MRIRRSVCLIAALSLLSIPSHADWGFGIIAGTKHFTDTPQGSDIPYNEKQEGFFVRYNVFTAGQFNNSFNRKSEFVGIQHDFSDKFSVGVIAANNYDPDNPSKVRLIPALTYRLGPTYTSFTGKSLVYGLQF